MQCHCLSEKTFSNCCEPFLLGQLQPETAEQLMRSRYTAFATGNMDYVLKTHDPKRRQEVDMEGNEKWSKSVEWLGLEILNVEEGQQGDDKGWVEFVARFKNDEGEQKHHELSEFRKRDGVWYFVDGRNRAQVTVVRDQPKVGRNDPCPCDSGKKFKKCCGAN